MTHRSKSLEVGARWALACALLSALVGATVLSRLHSPGKGEASPSTLPPIDYSVLGSPPPTTSWQLPDYPLIEAMQQSIVPTLRMCETRFEGSQGPVFGLVPAQEYGRIYVRDTSTMMPALSYFYGEEYLRTPIEEFLRRQYSPATMSADGSVPGQGAISAVIAPDGHIDKATVVSDEETHLVNAAYQFYKIVGGRDWLSKRLAGETVISRLNQAVEWLYTHRFDHTLGLIKRGHTTDWGDVKFEPSDSPTDLDPDIDHWTCSTYDQALTYRALLQLAEMNRVVGDTNKSVELSQLAGQLRTATDARLWNSTGGFYRLHLHVTPLAHPFPEDDMVSISNALVVYAGLSDSSRTSSALASLERARLAAGAGKPGLCLYPPYPPGFFAHPQMSAGEYQNGGLWDWWGAAQISAEFLNGESILALAHLRMMAQDWAIHPGQIFEWQRPSTGEGWGANNYASAAATTAEAIVRGLFGVTVEQDGVTIRTRLGKHDGRIGVVQPSTGFYVSYEYRHYQGFVVIDYGSNHPRALDVGLLLPRGREIERVSIDGREVSYRVETLLADRYCLFSGDSGIHRAVITFKNRLELGARHTVSDSSSRTRPS